MLEQTKRISFRISSVLSKVERKPDLDTCSDQKVLAPTGSATLHTLTHRNFSRNRTLSVSYHNIILDSI